MPISSNDFQKPSLNMNPRDKRNRAGPAIISMLYMKKFEHGHLWKKALYFRHSVHKCCLYQEKKNNNKSKKENKNKKQERVISWPITNEILQDLSIGKC